MGSAATSRVAASKESEFGTKPLLANQNPCISIKVSGSPAYVMSRGKVIFEGDKFLGKAGYGQFIKRGTYNLT